MWFTPYVAGGASDAITALFQWYWGKTQGTHSPGIFSNVYTLYNGVMLAGPKLTPKSFNAALGEVPVERGRLPGHDHQPRDRHRAGPDPAARHRARRGGTRRRPEGRTRSASRARGSTRTSNGGKRYLTGKYPEKLQPFFDASKSTLQFDTVPAQDVIGPYPCDNCPSTGGSQTPATAS